MVDEFYNAEIDESFDADSYLVKTEYFEGPLDLLLNLIRQAKINIEDIFVSDITSQYVAYVAQMDKLDLENAAAFIELAVKLLEMKSKAMLPHAEGYEEAQQERKEFIRKLKEYELIKEAGVKLKTRETVGAFYRSPDETVGDTRIILGDLSLEKMMKALEGVFVKMEKRALTPKQRSIKLDPYTVEDKIKHIRESILFKKQCVFEDLFESDRTKTEVITTFQALLELLKLQEIRAVQAEAFGEILIEAA